MLWNDSYCIGNLILDAEHKYAIDLIDIYTSYIDTVDDTNTSLVDTASILISMIKDHITIHFHREQSFMDIAAANGYSNKQAHIEEHERIRQQLFPLIHNPTKQNLKIAMDTIVDHTTVFDGDLSNKLKLSVQGLRHEKKQKHI